MRWHTKNGKWEARICDSAKRKQVTLGYFDSEEEAAAAYEAESKRIRRPHTPDGVPSSANLRLTGAKRKRHDRGAPWPLHLSIHLSCYPALGRTPHSEIEGAAAMHICNLSLSALD